jgi:hypothetical protein
MKNSIIVWFNGLSLTVSNNVAKQFNIQNRYRIKTEAEFLEILGANASYMLAAITPMIKNDN